jgi:type III restriction enzyme
LIKMKLQFKTKAYQSRAVDAVIDCFDGQPYQNGLNYNIDQDMNDQLRGLEEGFRNSEIASDVNVLGNIKAVQQRQYLPLSDRLVPSPACPLNLDIEMETGTGKTYVYTKTILEMNKRYGWSKFIIMVPSIAIREGVYFSLKATTDHFTEQYGKKLRFFIYNSQRLDELKGFSSDSGINVMIINAQAFNADPTKGSKDARRIHRELDEFQSRKPIDVIGANRPIIILDEPQKLSGKKTVEGIAAFKPLMLLRYSATHREEHNKVYRLDAVDAYNEKLVKKIEVAGIKVQGLAGTSAYLYLEAIETSRQTPIARLHFEIKSASGEPKIKSRRIQAGDNLYKLSKQLDEYDGYVVSDINALENYIEFINGERLYAGQATRDITEGIRRRIQIRQTIKAHLEKEQTRFDKGIKTLSLFFIDEVAKYRDYNTEDDKGEYARIFEEIYSEERQTLLNQLPSEHKAYRKYLERIAVERTHNGYFSIDKRSKQLVDPKSYRSGDASDPNAYDLILKDKERLLSLEEDTRFIFSHSALREGWDNPNVFNICLLKQSDNRISRRQEVGRGLRLCINDRGERMDDPATVHDLNILTVIASESYQEFVSGLQTEIKESLSARPQKVDAEYFEGQIIITAEGHRKITDDEAKAIWRYLIKNDYTDDQDQLTQGFYDAKAAGVLVDMPETLSLLQDQIFQLIAQVYSDSDLPQISDASAPKTNLLNENFNSAQFKELWRRINKKAVYRVDFDSDELIARCITELNTNLKVTKLAVVVQTGIQNERISDSDINKGTGFKGGGRKPKLLNKSIGSKISYDLLGRIALDAELTRKTVARILTGIETSVFQQFKQNPEHFIAEATRLIKEQKATTVVEKLSYDEVAAEFSLDIFTESQERQNFEKAVRTKKHIQDYAIWDSMVEKKFIEALDKSPDVDVYAKLPKTFKIPTPVGDYSPDWAISFAKGSVKHMYFVAETKGSLSSLQLREIEQVKIQCARKFFDLMESPNNIKYGVVENIDRLFDLAIS